MAIRKFQTTCCAMCIFSASDNDSLEDLKHAIERVKQESLQVWGPNNRDSGEKAIQIVTTPHEPILEDNLKKLGFVEIHQMSRRNGYPQTGNLKLHILSW